MEPTVIFRDFEERDIDFIYRCKNDEKLNSMIVGQYHPFTYEEATEWVHGCMGEHETYKFWAIATNDDEKRIVGWVSISEIDKVNNSAFFHSIVIGNDRYRGFAWIYAHLFVFDYVFHILNMHRLAGACLAEHKQSRAIAIALGYTEEGIKREASKKNGKYHDVYVQSLLKDEYEKLLLDGEYAVPSIIRRLRIVTHGKQN